MILLKDAGATEIRLNIEVPDLQLSKKLMPNKNLNDIFISVSLACEIYGRGKVSSNILLGVGESDKAVLEYIEKLAQIGAIATLYPYDPIESNQEIVSFFKRPDANRLYRLAVEHKKILAKYGLDTNTLVTMCPACAASHIFPGKDL